MSHAATVPSSAVSRMASSALGWSNRRPPHAVRRTSNTSSAARPTMTVSARRSGTAYTGLSTAERHRSARAVGAVGEVDQPRGDCDRQAQPQHCGRRHEVSHGRDTETA